MKRTDQLDQEKYCARIAKRMKIKARRSTSNGHMTPKHWKYQSLCTRSDNPTGAKLIFTRDTDHHKSGWFKNPDYDQCYHLSISPLALSGLVSPSGHALVRELSKEAVKLWVLAFFGDHLANVWAEGPKTRQGKEMNVWHWRLFCDERWKPLAPRKEVYSTEFTSKGWRSASQVLEEDGITIESPLYPG